MSQENVEIVRLAYDQGYVQRSVEGPWRKWFADDYRFHARAEFPGRAVYTIEQMTELWADLDATYSDFELVPQEFADLGDYVLVTIKQSSRLRDSDLRVEDTIYHLWQVTNGKAQEAWGYSDRNDALEAAGLSDG